jgi:hypothetical protein
MQATLRAGKTALAVTCYVTTNSSSQLHLAEYSAPSVAGTDIIYVRRLMEEIGCAQNQTDRIYV